MTTVKDICATLENGRHVQNALHFAFDIPPETEINRAIRRLDEKIRLETALEYHWSYSHNLNVAMRQAKLSLGVGLLNVSMQP